MAPCLPIIGLMADRKNCARTAGDQRTIMTTIKRSIYRFNARMVCVTLLTAVFGGSTLLVGADPATQDAGQAHAAHGKAARATLVQRVRDATKRFADVNAATAAGYQPFLG